MPMFRSIVFTAALAGLLAGLLLTIAQHLGTVPLILKAEVYEQAAEPAAAAPTPMVAGHDHASHEHEAWSPQDGFERTAFTFVANIITGTGFALLLVAGFALRGGAIGWRQGLFWGLAGFAVFMLAPSLGLPPELPGMPVAELGPRQVWWLLTAAATAAGLALLAFRRDSRLGCSGNRAPGGAASRWRAPAGRSRDFGPGDPGSQFRRRRDGHQLPVLGGLGGAQRHLLRALRPRHRSRPLPACPYGAMRA